MMGYEIDFLPVGEGEQCGDAIAIRMGNLMDGNRDEQFVVVVDGGFQETGSKVVEHIKEYYGTNLVDLVILSHPDSDHASGLEVVLEEMEVKELWMHQPWEHTDDIAQMFEDGRVTDKSVEEKLRKALDSAKKLEELAVAKGIPIVEPFAGLKDDSGHISVVGPTEEYYEELLPEFRATPEPKATSGFLKRTIEAGTGLVEKVAETLHIETLDDSGETTAENNSSTILKFEVNGRRILLTADAGIPALTNATDWLEDCCEETCRWAFIQVPHHGSKRNVGPTILNRLIGPKPEETKKMTAFVSASKNGGPKHPAKKVTNAFRRRGAYVYATTGRPIWHHHKAPDRKNWSSIDPLPLYPEVDE